MTAVRHDNDHPSRDERHDLLFVGAGASTAYTLLGVLSGLADRSAPPRPLRICVVERAPEPFSGLPYGGRASRTCLLITALRDFLPDGERAAFSAWLAANKSWVFDEYVRSAGRLGRRWWERHRTAIDRDDVESLFLPRYVFGAYLTARTWAAIEDAEVTGRATTTVVADEVGAVERDPGGYAVTCTAGRLLARQVVLATGSPTAMPRLRAWEGRSDALLLDDPFEDLPAAMSRVAERLCEERDGPAHVVVLGGNASTMDVLYQVNDFEGSDDAVFTVLTPQGELPARIPGTTRVGTFRARHLAALTDGRAPKAVDLHDAALADIRDGRALGLSAADTLQTVSQGVIRLLPRLSDDEAAEFAARWGVELGRYQRRAGAEYWEVVDLLQERQRLQLVAGAFRELSPAEDGSATVVYRDPSGGTRSLDRPVDVVVNCAGPVRDLTVSAPAVLADLFRQGTCRPTRYGAGIAVDSTMAAAPGLYVMGPLLAGNVLSGNPLWHMEHCGRISAFGTRLGTELAGTLVAA